MNSLFPDQQKQSGGSNNAGGNAAVEPIEKSLPVFDEQKYISKEKKSCLLCRRQFPNLETLEKHVQMSNLHKVNYLPSPAIKFSIKYLDKCRTKS
jgi:hypothetical protein